jgi:hypothetical protein
VDKFKVTEKKKRNGSTKEIVPLVASIDEEVTSWL